MCFAVSDIRYNWSKTGLILLISETYLKVLYIMLQREIPFNLNCNDIEYSLSLSLHSLLTLMTFPVVFRREMYEMWQIYHSDWAMRPIKLETETVKMTNHERFEKFLYFSF